MMPQTNIVWTDELREKVKVLWEEGHSAQKIGYQLNVSKNAIIGVVHRMGLPKRLNPVKPGASQPEFKFHSSRPVPTPTGPTLPPLKSVTKPIEVYKPPQLPRRVRATVECQWPQKINGKYTFCNAPAVRGSYCGQHAARAYRPRE